MNRLLAALAFGALLAPTSVPALWAEPFHLTVENESIVATGATAKRQVAFFGVTREVASDDVVEVNSHMDVLTDEDGDGHVAFPLGRAVPLRSA
jgi:hypothetical protein